MKKQKHNENAESGPTMVQITKPVLSYYNAQFLHSKML